MSRKRTLTASSWCRRAAARRRSWRVPLLPRVSIFSATDRAALAFGTVVCTRLCLMRLQTRFASMALRWSPLRPSLAVRFKCRIKSFHVRFLFLGPFEEFGFEGHAQGEAKGGELE